MEARISTLYQQNTFVADVCKSDDHARDIRGLLLAPRTCAMQSRTNTVERCMRLLNIGFQSVALTRNYMPAEVEKTIMKAVNSTSALGKAATNSPTLKSASEKKEGVGRRCISSPSAVQETF